MRGLVVPHSPVLLEYEVDGVKSPLISALRQEGEQLKVYGIETVIVITTHWQPENAFKLDPSAHHKTVEDYLGFRASIKYDCLGNPELAQKIFKEGTDARLPVEMAVHGADHAVHVPLHFIFPQADISVIPVSTSQMPLKECTKWGQAIRRAVEKVNQKTLIVATGVLSHNFTAIKRWQDVSTAGVYDNQVLELLEAGRGQEVPSLDPELINAGNPEGSFCDLFILLGALGGSQTAKTLAYESNPGIGMAVVRF